MVFLVILGIGLSYSIYSKEIARGGDLRLISQGISDASSTIGSQSETTGSFVASRSGRYFYTANCVGAKRIKEKNRVWFQSKEEAIARGYKLASNCSF